MHYYKSNNEIMQYCSFSNDIALIMHYRALLKRSDIEREKSSNHLNGSRPAKLMIASLSHSMAKFTKKSSNIHIVTQAFHYIPLSLSGCYLK